MAAERADAAKDGLIASISASELDSPLRFPTKGGIGSVSVFCCGRFFPQGYV
jgi:hypothetical protein